MKKVEYYAKVLIDTVYGEYRCGQSFDTRAEAEQDLLRLMKKYNSHGGYVQTYVN